MKNKGIVAILDSMAAYIVAFTAIGLLALLMTNSQEPEIRTSKALNVWAEDIADVVGMSMVDPNDYGKDWFSGTSSPIISDLESSLGSISQNRGIYISVQIDKAGGWTYTYTDAFGNDIGDAEEVVIATRYLKDYTIDIGADLISGTADDRYVPDGTLSILTVKIGI